MISIIIPIFNSENFLSDCIESLIHQSYKNIEIILIDDGSTDSSPFICDNFARIDSRIKVIHKSNGGQSSARNAGLQIATGSYVAFVDSDDWVDPDFCHILKDIIGDTDLAICAHRLVTKRETKPIQEDCADKIIKIDEDELWQEVFGRLNNAVWNKLYRRELLDGIRFPLQMYHGEDLLFNLEYITKCKVAVISNQPLYNYYKHTGSVTSVKFSPQKLFEITSKDAASKFIQLYRPSMLNIAMSYCFRARLNVLRSIYLSKVESKYPQVVSECKDYLKDNLFKQRESLSLKDKVECVLVLFVPVLYKLMLNTIK